MLPALLLCAALTGIGFWLWRHQQRRAESQRQRSGIERKIEREQAAALERQRIFNDLHDDIGAKLLTLVHTLENPEQADLARAVLQDLRDVVSRSSTGPCSLLMALAQIRDETEQRLEAVHSRLQWEQADTLPDPLLDEAQALHLFRISREAVTNAIRHAHVSLLRIRVRAVAGSLLLDFTDDGAGVLPEAAQGGRGTVSMRQRAAELHGQIAWDAGTQGGTKVILQFPLPTA